MMEEARLQFLRLYTGAQDGEDILGAINYPLIDCQVQYKRPLKYNQEVEIRYQASAQGVRLQFDYQFLTKSIDKPAAFGKTVHVAFDMKTQKTVRLPGELLDFLKNRGQ